MDRKQLKEAGLETEQIEKVMKIYGQSVQTYQNDLNETEKEVSTLKQSNEDKEKEITALKESSEGKNNQLQSEIDRLKEENKNFKKQIDETELDKTILKAVSKDAHDPDDIFKFVDKSKFEIDEETGEIKNLSEVIDGLKTDKPYLFNVVQNDANDGRDEDNKSNSGDSEPPATGNYGTNKQQGNRKPKIDYEELGRKQAEEIFKDEY